jgi:hypothetical protein
MGRDDTAPPSGDISAEAMYETLSDARRRRLPRDVAGRAVLGALAGCGSAGDRE